VPRSATRFILNALIVLLQGALITWVMCAPILWLVRDGLGPGSHESGWVPGIVRFSGEWGLPALALTLLLYGLKRVVRKM
jgi:hypothetical protein